jgi:hypothetical protein
MWFLIRATFWFSLVLLMLPFGSDESGNQVSPLQALLAARAAVDDFSGICERKPEVCETGKAALHTIGVRAKASAKLAYDMLDDEAKDTVVPARRPEAPQPDATIKTGTVVPAISNGAS